MKKLIAAAALVMFAAGASMAADTIVLNAKNGNVTFNHKKHQETLKDCKICHGDKTGKIENFNKDAAHKLCKGCHEEKKAGPTKCGECHKK